MTIPPVLTSSGTDSVTIPPVLTNSGPDNVTIPPVLTSSGTDNVTIPPVLTEQDIPGAASNHRYYKQLRVYNIYDRMQ